VHFNGYWFTSVQYEKRVLEQSLTLVAPNNTISNTSNSCNWPFSPSCYYLHDIGTSGQHPEPQNPKFGAPMAVQSTRFSMSQVPHPKASQMAVEFLLEPCRMDQKCYIHAQRKESCEPIKLGILGFASDNKQLTHHDNNGQDHQNTMKASLSKQHPLLFWYGSVDIIIS